MRTHSTSLRWKAPEAIPGAGGRRALMHAAEAASTGGGGGRHQAGTDTVFKSLGRKTTIKQLELRMAGEFEDAVGGGNGFVRWTICLGPNKPIQNTTHGRRGGGSPGSAGVTRAVGGQGDVGSGWGRKGSL